MRRDQNLAVFQLLLMAIPAIVLIAIVIHGQKKEMKVQQQPQRVQKPAPKNLVNQIRRNHPGLTPEYVANLARTFERVSKRYKLSPDRLSAMAMQESGYVLDAKQCYELNREIRCDFCMMQINDHTIQSYGFDVQKLMTDLDYCVDAGAQVLSDFRKQYAKTDKDWFTHYNAVSKEKRLVYKHLVERFM